MDIHRLHHTPEPMKNASDMHMRSAKRQSRAASIWKCIQSQTLVAGLTCNSRLNCFKPLAAVLGKHLIKLSQHVFSLLLLCALCSAVAACLLQSPPWLLPLLLLTLGIKIFLF
jgi:hypothetical protein